MEPTEAEVILRVPIRNSSSTMITNEGPYPTLSPEVRALLATAFSRGYQRRVECLAFIHWQFQIHVQCIERDMGNTGKRFAFETQLLYTVSVYVLCAHLNTFA